MPLKYKPCEALTAYLQVRIDVGYPALLLSQFKQPMSNWSIQQRVESI